jgi:hypothetical protein
MPWQCDDVREPDRTSVGTVRIGNTDLNRADCCGNQFTADSDDGDISADVLDGPSEPFLGVPLPGRVGRWIDVVVKELPEREQLCDVLRTGSPE